MSADTLITHALGPVGALVVALGILVVLYRLIVNHGIPLVQKLAERHLAQFDTLLIQHRVSGEATVNALHEIGKTQVVHQQILAQVQQDLREVSDKVEALHVARKAA